METYVDRSIEGGQHVETDKQASSNVQGGKQHETTESKTEGNKATRRRSGKIVAIQDGHDTPGSRFHMAKLMNEEWIKKCGVDRALSSSKLKRSKANTVSLP